MTSRAFNIIIGLGLAVFWLTILGAIMFITAPATMIWTILAAIGSILVFLGALIAYGVLKSSVTRREWDDEGRPILGRKVR